MNTAHGHAGAPNSFSATRQPSKFVLAATLVTMLLIWSLNYIVGKITLRHLDAFTLVSFRFQVAAIVALAVYFTRRRPVMPRGRDLWTFIYLGFFGIFINQGCFTVGLSYTTSEHSVIIVSLGPILVLLLASALRLEKMTAVKVAGMAISIIGVLVLEARHASALHSHLLVGDLITLGGTTGFAMFAVLGKRVAAKYDHVSMITYNIIVAAILLMPLAVRQGMHLHWASVGWVGWLGMCYMAALSSVAAYMMFYWVLRYVEATKVVVINYCQPAIVILLSVPLLGESPTWNLVAGSALVLLGVYLAERISV